MDTQVTSQFDPDVIVGAKDRFDVEVVIPAIMSGTGFLGCIPYKKMNALPSADYVYAPLDHPNIKRAEDLLSRWPAAYSLLTQFCQGIVPLQRASQADDLGLHPWGCSCGGVGGAWGEVYSTVFCPVGFAEGIMHEMGHWRLHALGIGLMSWDGWIANDSEELFDSSIRKDIQRPMGACLHAHYSYLFVTEVHILAATEPAFKQYPYVESLGIQIGRVEEGLATIEKNIRPDGDKGHQLWDAIKWWTHDVLGRGRELLSVAPSGSQYEYAQNYEPVQYV